MRRSTINIGAAQFSFVIEITPKSPSFVRIEALSGIDFVLVEELSGNE